MCSSTFPMALLSFAFFIHHHGNQMIARRIDPLLVLRPPDMHLAANRPLTILWKETCKWTLTMIRIRIQSWWKWHVSIIRTADRIQSSGNRAGPLPTHRLSYRQLIIPYFHQHHQRIDSFLYESRFRHTRQLSRQTIYKSSLFRVFPRRFWKRENKI